MISDSPRNLQKKLNIWNEELKAKKLKINRSKIKVMSVGDDDINIELEKKVEQVH